MRAFALVAALALSGCTGFGGAAKVASESVDARFDSAWSELEQVSGGITEKVDRWYRGWMCERMSIREWARWWGSRPEEWQALCSTPQVMPIIDDAK